MAKCAHGTIEVISRCPDCGQGLSQDEIAAQAGAELPDREAMSLANLNVAVPINLAAALNVLSDGSLAAAAAQQTGAIDQST